MWVGTLRMAWSLYDGLDWHHVNENKTEKVTVWRLETVTAWRMCVGDDARMRVR